MLSICAQASALSRRNWSRPAPRRKACRRSGCGSALATGSATGSTTGGGGMIGSGAGAALTTGAGASPNRSQSSGITEPCTNGFSGAGTATGAGGRKSCCSDGTWSATVGGGTAVGLRKSNRSGRVSMAEAPWNCGAIIGVGAGGLATAPISASKLLGESPANGWLSMACTLKSIRAWIS